MADITQMTWYVTVTFKTSKVLMYASCKWIYDVCVCVCGGVKTVIYTEKSSWPEFPPYSGRHRCATTDGVAPNQSGDKNTLCSRPKFSIFCIVQAFKYEVFEA
jgi:hypothetical protein